MKKMQFVLLAVFTTIFVNALLFAQMPNKINYQAVIRNSDNELLTNQNISLQISILKGSVSGTAVYVETQSATTNANGLITIEIGNGTVVSGDFTTIDWADGPYFIKTEVDINGGTNYTLMTVSQLLSVPYALHAKTAESLTNGIEESDPVFTSSQAYNITENDITNLSNLSGVNTGDQDLSNLATKTELSDTAAVIRNYIEESSFITSEEDPVFTNSQAYNITKNDITNLSNLSGVNTGDQTISRSGSTITLSNGGSFIDSVITYKAGDGIAISGDTISKKKYKIGDFAFGGVVFWVDESGEHGLVCLYHDIGEGTAVPWYAGSFISTRAFGRGIYAGRDNTMLIITIQLANGGTATNYAAFRCFSYYNVSSSTDMYGDWYLPSSYELSLMYAQKDIINASVRAHTGLTTRDFKDDFYWCSQERDATNAYVINFADGSSSYKKKDGYYYARPVRRF